MTWSIFIEEAAFPNQDVVRRLLNARPIIEYDPTRRHNIASSEKTAKEISRYGQPSADAFFPE